MRKLFFLLVFILLALGVARAGDGLIVPGERLGDFVLEKTTMADLEKMLGRPEQVETDDQLESITYKYRNLVFFFDRSSRKLNHIMLWEMTEYRTAEGIGIGTEETAIKKAFGEPDSLESSERHKDFYYHGRGIFLATDDGRITALSVLVKI